MSPYIAFGSAINWYVNGFYNSSTYDANDEQVTTKFKFQDQEGFDIRQVNISAKTDVGFNYQLTEKLNLSTFISGNMLLLTTNKTNFYNPRNFNIGLGIGVGYSI
ncbi:MAG: hypothetical protein HC803_10090 [Saprospiraceae bacterium]|nr:hypothetical protein [Saprospiraceae bacterium]